GDRHLGGGERGEDAVLPLQVDRDHRALRVVHPEGQGVGERGGAARAGDLDEPGLPGHAADVAPELGDLQGVGGQALLQVGADAAAVEAGRLPVRGAHDATGRNDMNSGSTRGLVRSTCRRTNLYTSSLISSTAGSAPSASSSQRITATTTPRSSSLRAVAPCSPASAVRAAPTSPASSSHRGAVPAVSCSASAAARVPREARTAS